jgi:hypothetical protein
MPIDEKFTEDLEHLINRHSVDSEARTPDFILAEMVSEFLLSVADATNKRERWYGRLSDNEKKQLANPKGK